MKMTDTNPPQPVDHTWFSQAALDVTAERRRQIEELGWHHDHDDGHDRGELAKAAACYALGEIGVSGSREFVSFWPWANGGPSRDQRSNLVKAGALILAEIERLDRAAGVSVPPVKASDEPNSR